MGYRLNSKEIFKNGIKEWLSDSVVFILLLGLFSTLLGVLAYRQAAWGVYRDDYFFRSDVLAYMQEMQGIDSGYPFPYPVFFKLGALLVHFMPVEAAVVTLEVFFNGLAIIASKYYAEKLILKGSDKWYRHIVITLTIFGCFMLSMLWLPKEYGLSLPLKYSVYRGTFTGNPWHNATYIATRPFAVVAFFSFIENLETYEKKLNVRSLIVFGVSLLLTTLTKPSYTFVAVSTAGLIMAYRLIRAKLKNFKNTMWLTLSFIPTFITLLYQFSGVFGSNNEREGEHGIGFFFFDLWKFQNPYIPAAVFYANVFSIVCLVLFWKDLKKDTMYRFALILFLVGFLEAGILYEKGTRMYDFNFSWGYMHGIFFWWLASAVKLVRAGFERARKWYFLIWGWIAWFAQLVAGSAYLYWLLCGANYE